LSSAFSQTFLFFEYSMDQGGHDAAEFLNKFGWTALQKQV